MCCIFSAALSPKVNLLFSFFHWEAHTTPRVSACSKWNRYARVTNNIFTHVIWYIPYLVFLYVYICGSPQTLKKLFVKKKVFTKNGKINKNKLYYSKFSDLRKLTKQMITHWLQCTSPKIRKWNKKQTSSFLEVHESTSGVPLNTLHFKTWKWRYNRFKKKVADTLCTLLLSIIDLCCLWKGVKQLILITSLIYKYLPRRK